MDQSELFQRGLENRMAVLGRDYVENSLANANGFTRPLQEFVTEYCWGANWSRPGLDFKTRSLINLALMSALNRQHELSIHVRGAINNGCAVDEIREVLIHTAVYCGVPAAMEASRTVDAVLSQLLPGVFDDAGAESDDQ